jgi:putative membrane protein
MMGFGGAGMMLWMVIFWVVVVGVALWLLSRLFPGTREQSGSQQSPTNGLVSGGSGRALDILNERYARGEITRAEYQEMRRDMEG